MVTILIIKQIKQNMSLEDLDGIFGPQTDWSISELRLSYEVDTNSWANFITFISNINMYWHQSKTYLCKNRMEKWQSSLMMMEQRRA